MSEIFKYHIVTPVFFYILQHFPSVYRSRTKIFTADIVTVRYKNLSTPHSIAYNPPCHYARINAVGNRVSGMSLVKMCNCVVIAMESNSGVGCVTEVTSLGCKLVDLDSV